MNSVTSLLMKKIVKNAGNSVAHESSFSSVRSVNSTVKFNMRMSSTANGQGSAPRNASYASTTSSSGQFQAVENLFSNVKTTRQVPENVFDMPKNFKVETFDLDVKMD